MNASSVKSSRKKNAIRNLLWGIASRVVTLLLPFLNRTLLIYVLGTLYLGLDGLFTSLLQVVNLCELGISSAIIYNMYAPLARNETDVVCALLNFYRKSYRWIGVVVGMVGLVLLPFLDKLITGDLPQDIDIYIIYTMQLAGTVFSYELFAHKVALLNAVQRNDIISKIRMLVSVVTFLLQFVVLIFVENYYLYVFAGVLGTVVQNLYAEWVTQNMFPDFICLGHVSRDEAKCIWKKVRGLVYQKIGNVVLHSADAIIISAFLGLNQLAIYQNYYLIFTAVAGFFGVIYSSLIPSVGNSIVVETPEKNYRDYRTFNFLYIWLATWASVCLLCMYQPFMSLWVGESLMLSDGMVLLLAACFFVFRWCDMSYIYQTAAGLWWEMRYVPIVAGVINLVVNMLLIQHIGLAGVVLSTIISILLVYNTGFVYVVIKRIFYGVETVGGYWKHQILYMPVAILVGFITWEIVSLVSFSGVPLFIGCFIICMIVPNFIMLVVWHRRQEFQFGVALFLPQIRKIKERIWLLW